MRDHTGEQWLTVADAAARVYVRPQTIYVWMHRRAVRVHKIGGRAYVHLADVAACERAWRQSGRIRGSRTVRQVAPVERVS